MSPPDELVRIFATTSSAAETREYVTSWAKPFSQLQYECECLRIRGALPYNRQWPHCLLNRHFPSHCRLHIEDTEFCLECTNFRYCSQNRGLMKSVICNARTFVPHLTFCDLKTSIKHKARPSSPRLVHSARSATLDVVFAQAKESTFDPKPTYSMQSSGSFSKNAPIGWLWNW